MGAKDKLPREEVIEFVLSCQHPSGGFGSNPEYDPHLLYTLSAVQILLIEDAMDRIDKDKVAKCMYMLFEITCGVFFFLLFSFSNL